MRFAVYVVVGHIPAPRARAQLVVKFVRVLMCAWIRDRESARFASSVRLRGAREVTTGNREGQARGQATARDVSCAGDGF